MKLLRITTASVFLIAAAACGSSQEAEPQAPEAPAAPAETPMADEKPAADIVDTAIAAGSFSTLVEALKAAELVEALRGDGPFTVFAPTDEAFAKLPAGTVEGLLADKEKLKAVLTYHVVSGSVMAADVAGMSSAATLQGGSLAISSDGGVKINDANVIKADIKTKNGVIHVIDTVLIPQ